VLHLEPVYTQVSLASFISTFFFFFFLSPQKFSSIPSQAGPLNSLGPVQENASAGGGFRLKTFFFIFNEFGIISVWQVGSSPIRCKKRVGLVSGLFHYIHHFFCYTVE
jgi:hypothetical protein